MLTRIESVQHKWKRKWLINARERESTNMQMVSASASRERERVSVWSKLIAHSSHCWFDWKEYKNKYSIGVNKWQGETSGESEVHVKSIVTFYWHYQSTCIHNHANTGTATEKGEQLLFIESSIFMLHIRQWYVNRRLAENKSATYYYGIITWDGREREREREGERVSISLFDCWSAGFSCVSVKCCDLVEWCNVQGEARERRARVRRKRRKRENAIDGYKRRGTD